MDYTSEFIFSERSPSSLNYIVIGWRLYRGDKKKFISDHLEGDVDIARQRVAEHLKRLGYVGLAAINERGEPAYFERDGKLESAGQSSIISGVPLTRMTPIRDFFSALYRQMILGEEY